MILCNLIQMVLLDVVAVPEVFSSAPLVILIIIGSGAVLVIGVALLKYFLVDRDRKKK